MVFSNVTIVAINLWLVLLLDHGSPWLIAYVIYLTLNVARWNSFALTPEYLSVCSSCVLESRRV